MHVPLPTTPHSGEKRPRLGETSRGKGKTRRSRAIPAAFLCSQGGCPIGCNKEDVLEEFWLSLRPETARALLTVPHHSAVEHVRTLVGRRRSKRRRTLDSLSLLYMNTKPTDDIVSTVGLSESFIVSPFEVLSSVLKDSFLLSSLETLGQFVRTRGDYIETLEMETDDDACELQEYLAQAMELRVRCALHVVKLVGTGALVEQPSKGDLCEDDEVEDEASLAGLEKKLDPDTRGQVEDFLGFHHIIDSNVGAEFCLDDESSNANAVPAPHPDSAVIPPNGLILTGDNFTTPVLGPAGPNGAKKDDAVSPLAIDTTPKAADVMSPLAAAAARGSQATAPSPQAYRHPNHRDRSNVPAQVSDGIQLRGDRLLSSQMKRLMKCLEDPLYVTSRHMGFPQFTVPRRLDFIRCVVHYLNRSGYSDVEVRLVGSTVRDVLCNDGKTNPQDMDVLLQVWFKPNGVPRIGQTVDDFLTTYSSFVAESIRSAVIEALMEYQSQCPDTGCLSFLDVQEHYFFQQTMSRRAGNRLALYRVGDGSPQDLELKFELSAVVDGTRYPGLERPYSCFLDSIHLLLNELIYPPQRKTENAQVDCVSSNRQQALEDMEGNILDTDCPRADIFLKWLDRITRSGAKPASEKLLLDIGKIFFDDANAWNTALRYVDVHYRSGGARDEFMGSLNSVAVKLGVPVAPSLASMRKHG